MALRCVPSRPMDTGASGGAIAALLHALGRVRQHHVERAANQDLARALDALGAWQGRRLRATYADLEAMPRQIEVAGG